MCNISGFKNFFWIVLLVFIVTGCDSSDGSKNTQSVDTEAQRIRSVGKLLESVSRQPELEEQLVQQHEDCSQYDGSYLEMTDCQLIEARVVAFGRYIEGFARQPEMEPQLKALFDSHAGLLNPTQILSCENALYLRNIAVGYLLTAVSRQPEMAETLKAMASEYIGEFLDYPVIAITTPLVLAGRVQLAGTLIESVARQPELEDLLEELVTLYAGHKSLVTENLDCIVNSARLDVLSFLTAATARQPELFFDLDDCVGDSCGMFVDYFEDQVGVVQTDQLRGGCILPISLNGDL